MKVAVSYLDSPDILKTLDLIDKSKADYIHVDLMDGIYVPRKNFDASITNILTKRNKPLDIHLMVNNPIQYLNYFKDLNVDSIIVHPKEVPNMNLLIKELKENNINMGIAINPDESINEYQDLLLIVNKVLVLSVHPGKGGQEFIPEVLTKIPEIRKINPNIIIGVDGGINEKTIKLLKDIDYIVSGSYIWHSNNYDEQINLLKKEL